MSSATCNMVMMKCTLLTIAILLCTASTAPGQSLYKDALVLSEIHLPDDESVLDDYLGESEANSYLNYLRKYMPDGGGEINSRDVKRHYQGNPFLAPFVAEGGANSLLTALPLSRLTSSISALNSDFSVVADGLSQFLIERAQTELAVSLFRSFRRELDKQFELGMLFPQTHRLLQAIDTEIYNADAYVQAIRTAFRTDLGAGLHNMGRLLRSDRYVNRFKSPAVRAMVLEALPTAELFIDGEHPAMVLAALAESELLREEPSLARLHRGLELANLVSKSLWDNQQWIPADDLRRLLTGNKGRTLLIYLGLLYEEGRNVVLHDAGWQAAGDSTSVASAVPLQQVLAGFLQRDQLGDVRQLLEGFFWNTRQVQTAIRDLRDIQRSSEQQAGFDDYFRVSQATVGLVRSGYELKSGLLKESGVDAEADQFIRLLDAVSMLGMSIEQKNYASIVLGIAAFLGEAVLPDTIDKYRRPLLRYGALVAGLAEAETPEEVRLAFQASTLPPGSSSIKKLNKRSFALAAYVGGFYGGEYLNNAPGDNNKPSAGVTIPIGLSYSFGLNADNHGAITLFASLIDIGAFGAYRFKDETLEKLPSVQLKNVFAPGGYLVLDFPKAPVSLGVGAQFGPNVRELRKELDETGTEIVRPASVSGYRFGVFLAMDVPLLNLYTKYR